MQNQQLIKNNAGCITHFIIPHWPWLKLGQSLGLLLFLVIIGCTPGKKGLKDWTLTQYDDRVVWADDGSEVAVVTLSFEEKSGGFLSGTTDKRHFKHQIFLQNADGSGRRALTGLREYQNGELFFMKRSGYLVVESLQTNGTHRFDKIDLAGKEIPIVEETTAAGYRPCGGPTAADQSPATLAQVSHSVIPSPDGGQLVEVYSTECGKATVEFLYANNLTTIDNQTFDIDGPMQVTWHPEGYVMFVASDKAWKVSAHAPPLPVEVPRCTQPVTTSSSVSLDGQRVSLKEGKVVVEAVGHEQVFGCQSLPLPQ